jgi:hypothetical protein
MVTAEERFKILSMLQEGRITPEAATELLQAMGDEFPEAPSAPGHFSTENPFPPAEPGPKPRWLRVRVTDTNTGRPRVNVRLPISLVNLGLKLGAKYSPEIEGMDLGALLAAAQSSEAGPMVDVYDHEDGEHVEVFLE